MWIHLQNQLAMFQKRKLAKKLASIGSRVESSFMLHLNNEPAMTFQSKEDLLKYLETYRETNTIYSLAIYRVDVYSL